MNNIEERLNKIEQSMRLWRRAAVGLGVVLVLVTAVAASRQDEVQDIVKTRRLIVVNEEGKIAAQITGSSYGGTLTTYNKNENEAYSFSPGYLQMKNDKDKLIFSVEQSGNATSLGSGIMSLRDAGGDGIMQFARSGDGYGYIQISDKDGKNTMYGPAYR